MHCSSSLGRSAIIGLLYHAVHQLNPGTAINAAAAKDWLIKAYGSNSREIAGMLAGDADNTVEMIPGTLTYPSSLMATVCEAAKAATTYRPISTLLTYAAFADWTM